MSQQLIAEIAAYMQQHTPDDHVGHDWWHVKRVWALARYINEREGGDSFLVEVSALLHDYDDWKFQDGSSPSHKTQKLLESFGVDAALISPILTIIDQVSFKGGIVPEQHLSLEAKIVQDADRLDAIGAVGIARAFAYGGYAKQILHDPEMPINTYQTVEAYQNKKTTSINHFHEKLLKINGLLKTKTGRALGQKRHEYMEGFIDEFLTEWHEQGGAVSTQTPSLASVTETVSNNINKG